MKRPIRALASLVIATALTFASSAGFAAFPDRPIRLVVGYTPGSGTDVAARALAQRLSELFKQPVVVDNRPGAGANIAADFVAKSPPDGYTLLFTATGIAMSPGLYRNLPYKPEDLVPVAQVTSGPHMLIVNASVPVNSAKELIEYIKARPGKVSFASSGIGSPDHLAGELMKSMAGLDMVHVPYKGGPPAMNDVVAGRVEMYFPSLSTGLPFVKSGKVKALAVTTQKPSPALPDVPTLSDAALPGFEVTLWFGIFAPAGTPADVIQKINADVNTVLRMPEIQQLFTTLGTSAAPGTSAAFAGYVKAETDRWTKAIKAIGVTAE